MTWRSSFHGQGNQPPSEIFPLDVAFLLRRIPIIVHQSNITSNWQPITRVVEKIFLKTAQDLGQAYFFQAKVYNALGFP